MTELMQKKSKGKVKEEKLVCNKKKGEEGGGRGSESKTNQSINKRR